jgi:hypothetical protein
MNPAAVTITTDERTGFPMLALEGLPFRVSWLPLTWVQLEYFLSETADHAFDAAWYQALVARTQRGTPAGLAADSVHTLFVRTLRLQEIRMICRWWEVTHWYVPTREEWMALQAVACSVPAVPLAQLAAAAPGLNPRALRILQVLGEVSEWTRRGKAPSLADQMLLCHGVHELVLLDKMSDRVAAIGSPARSLEPFATDPLVYLAEQEYGSGPPIGVRLFAQPS